MLTAIDSHKEALKIFFYTHEKKYLVYVFFFEIFVISCLDTFSLAILFPYLQFIANESKSFANLDSSYAQDLSSVTILCCIVITSAFLARYVLMKRVVQFAYAQEKNLSDSVISSVLNFSLEQFSELKDANIYRLVSTEIPQAVNAYFVGMVYMASGALSAFLIVALMVFVNPSLALYSFALLAGFYFLIYIIISKNIDKLGLERLRLNEKKVQYVFIFFGIIQGY